LAGVKRINVSLDTLKRRRFQEISGKNGLDDVLAGIQAARAEGLTPVKVNTVLIRDLNDDEIPAFLSFAQDAGVQLRFIEFMPVGWQDWAQGRVLPSREVRRRIASIASLEAVAPRDASPAANYRLKGTKTLVGFVSPISEPFCKRCNRLRLTADGHLRPCLFSDTEIDLKTPLRSGINEDGLRGLMLEALRAKPRNYVLRSPSRDAGPRPMAEIGG
jgi:cyclic pyranopterin phosphate synthase